MSIVKVIEIMASSPKSWEDAAQQAVTEAAKKLRNIRSFYIREHHTMVEDGKIKEFRVTGELAFEWEGPDWSGKK